MIDYETFSKIHDCHDRQGLTIAQTARALGLDPRTVATWVARSRFEPRRSRPRSSVLDPFKPRIIRLLDSHPYSAQQIFQRLREEGYRGGVTILRDYVRCIRPTKRPVYLKLHFAPGECAQVDWGAYGTVAVGNTRRRLSFFVMVLAFSRQMFVEFTVSQTMEHFLACHEHGFAALGVPSKIMVDNLKSAVLQRLAGAAPVFNPRYLDFARHHGFAIEACNVARGKLDTAGAIKRRQPKQADQDWLAAASLRGRRARFANRNRRRQTLRVAVAPDRNHEHCFVRPELSAASGTRKIRMRWHCKMSLRSLFRCQGAFFGRKPTVRGERHASHGTYVCCRVGDLLRGLGFSRA